MLIYCIGDSLTEGDYGIFGKSGISNIHAENYPFFMEKYLGVKTVNNGKCGFNASMYLDYYKNSGADVSGADIIVVMLGTNGGLDPDAETDGNRDFEKILDLCHKGAPSAKIVLCTPPHVTENPEMSNCGYAAQVRSAVEFVRKIAEKRALALIDVADCGKFTAETEAQMQPNDGLHFGETGYKTLAAVIGDGLKKLYPDLF